jgi:hypothetical protein
MATLPKEQRSPVSFFTENRNKALKFTRSHRRSQTKAMLRKKKLERLGFLVISQSHHGAGMKTDVEDGCSHKCTG